MNRWLIGVFVLLILLMMASFTSCQSSNDEPWGAHIPTADSTGTGSQSKNTAPTATLVTQDDTSSASTTSTEETSAVVPTETQPREEETPVTVYNCFISFTDDIAKWGVYPYINVFRSKSQLESYLQENREYNTFDFNKAVGEHLSMTQYCQKYDAAFFRTKALVDVVYEGKIDELPSVFQVSRSGNKLIVTLEKIYDYIEGDTQVYHILIEVKLADLPEDDIYQEIRSLSEWSFNPMDPQTLSIFITPTTVVFGSDKIVATMGKYSITREEMTAYMLSLSLKNPGTVPSCEDAAAACVKNKIAQELIAGTRYELRNDYEKDLRERENAKYEKDETSQAYCRMSGIDRQEWIDCWVIPELGADLKSRGAGAFAEKYKADHPDLKTPDRDLIQMVAEE